MIDIGALTKTGAWTLKDEGEGIWRLVFDLPGEKVNKLTSAVLEDLEAGVDRGHMRVELVGLGTESGDEGASSGFILGHGCTRDREREWDRYQCCG